MKTIGIVAVTAEGASDCYKHIVRCAGERLGINKHPDIVLVNPSFDTILVAQKQRDWQTVAGILSGAAQKAVQAGADFIILPANSVHFAYDLMAAQVTAPILNIVEVVADECKRKVYQKVAVLGVGLTMSDGLYEQPLARRSIQSVQLTEYEKDLLDKIIYEELVQGIVKADSTEKILTICERLKQEGSEALILACTELPMMLTNDSTPLSILDSTKLLAEAAVERAIDG